MIPIPIVFYWYGEKIRSKSKVIRQLREDTERNERRAGRAQQRKAGRINAMSSNGENEAIGKEGAAPISGLTRHDDV